MKKILLMASLLILSSKIALASVPSEEGLLRNLNNQELAGSNVSLKFSIQPLDDSAPAEFMRVYFQQESESNVGMLQVLYSNAQMLNSQITNIRYVPNVIGSARIDKNMERSLFDSTMLMLSLNNPYGFKVTMAKAGVQIANDKDVLNEDKMNLLKEYRTYLVNNKGRSDVGSPFNTDDAKAKGKNIELFKSNTFKRAENIELAKKNNEFMWKVDWKSTQAFFSNEQREFRVLEYVAGDISFKIDATSYLAFNGVNSFPKFLNVKEGTGKIVKMQTLSQEVRKTDKKLKDLYQEYKAHASEKASNYSFLF